MTWIERYTRLGRGQKILALVAIYILSGLLQVFLFFPVNMFGDLATILFLAAASALAAFGQLVLSGILVRVFKWRPGALAMALTGPFIVPLVLSVVTLTGFIVSNDADMLMFIAAVVVATLVTVLQVRMFSRDPTPFRAIRDAWLGMLVVAVIAKLMLPNAHFGGWISANHVAGPLIAFFCGLAVLFRRRDAGIFWIWPVGAVIASLVLSALLVTATDRADQFTFEAAVAGPNALRILVFSSSAFLAGVLWWLVGWLYSFGGIRAAALRGGSAYVTEEFAGTGATQLLDQRVQFLLRDVVYGAIAALLLYRSISDNVLFRNSVLVEVGAGASYLILVLFIVASLLLRLIWRRRLRPLPLLIGALAGGAVLSWGLFAISETSEVPNVLLVVAVVVLASILIVPILVMVLLRRVAFTIPGVAVGALLVGGALLCDLVFLILLGPTARYRFDIGLPVGDLAAVVTALAVGIAYWLNRQDRWAFLIWPVGGLVSGGLLRTLITVQGALDDLSSQITLRTDLGQVAAAAVLGALAGAGALLAKRVWYDRDPEARARAIRVRGALVIFHGISPLLILLFVLSSLYGFMGQARSDFGATSANAELLMGSVVGIADQSAGAFREVKSSVDKVVGRVGKTFDDSGALFKDLTGDLKATFDEAKAATLRATTAALADVKEKVTEVTDKVGDALSNLVPKIDIFGWKVEIPDLGIGKAIKNAFGGMLSGLIPDLDLGAMFQDLVAKSLARLEGEFADTKAKVEAMKQKVTDFANNHLGDVDEITADAIKKLKERFQKVDQLKDEAIEHFTATLTNIVGFLYHLLVFFLVLIVAVLLWLTWKAINGLVVMAGRVESGWKMMVQGEEPPPRPLAPRRAPAALPSPASTSPAGAAPSGPLPAPSS